MDWFEKTNTEGAGLPGAQFTVYEDANCTVIASGKAGPATISTGADGTGTVQVEWKSDSSTKNYWIKETIAHPDAQLRNNIWKVTVSSINNVIESNAVQVNGGTGIPNGTPQEPKGIVQKKSSGMKSRGD